MSKALRRTGAILLVVGIVAGLGAWQADRLYRAPGPLPAAAQVLVPRGGTEAIATALLRAGVIADGRSFTAAAWATRGEGAVHAAEFAFPAGASLQQVLDILRTAKPVQRKVTIPEGLSARQIVALLGRTEGLLGEAVVPEEGAILPETYAYQWGDDRGALLRRAQAAMGQALAAIWAERADGLPMTSPREALVLASIVERETALPEERPRIAAVFLNRLKRGMPLQSDPTVAYAAAAGEPLDRPLSKADLDRDHPFNTYRIRGLPPGRSAHPGASRCVR